jgi:peptidoglycan/xylan/chitin deacetylase (PgdA/CDA1 family)
MTKHQLNIIVLLIIIGGAFFIFEREATFGIISLLAFIVFNTVLIFGVFRIQFNYFGPAINTTNSDLCLLTFDDGPSEEFTAKILSVLKKHGIGAVFFVIGAKAEQNKSLLLQQKEDGHLIGNHTYSHHYTFAFKSAKHVALEIEKTEAIIHPNGMLIFRPPVGITNPIIAKVLKRKKIKNIGWSFRSLDTVIPTKEKLLRRLIQNVKQGDILLFHDNLKVTAEVIDDFIVQAKQGGIKFATPTDLKNIFI